MTNTLKIAIMSVFMMLGLLSAPILLSSPASAQLDCEGIQGCLDGGAQETEEAGGSADDAEERVADIVRTVINIFSYVVGIISVIMIIIGGLKYITSGGDSGNVTGAKNTILYAVIGLVVVALAQLIVRFVLKQVVTP
jgi:hypothetical protein